MLTEGQLVSKVRKMTLGVQEPRFEGHILVLKEALASLVVSTHSNFY